VGGFGWPCAISSGSKSSVREEEGDRESGSLSFSLEGSSKRILSTVAGGITSVGVTAVCLGFGISDSMSDMVSGYQSRRGEVFIRDKGWGVLEF